MGSPTRSDEAPRACSATCGISRERARQLEAARATAQRAYPGLAFAREPAWVPVEPHDERGLVALEARVEQVVPGHVTFEPALGDDAASLVVFVGLDAPSWWELRARGHAPERAGEQTYLRVLFSPLGPYYTLQECVLNSERNASGAFVTEKRHAGVLDRRLQLFVKALQGLLRSERFVSLDAVFLSELVPDPDGLAQRHLGEPPSLRTLLFEHASATLERTEWLPLAAPAPAVSP